MSKIEKEVPSISFSDYYLGIIFPSKQECFDLVAKNEIYIQPGQTKEVVTGIKSENGIDDQIKVFSDINLFLSSGYKAIIYPSILLENTPLILVKVPELINQLMHGYKEDMVLLIRNIAKRTNPSEPNVQGFTPIDIDRKSERDNNSPGISGVYRVKEGNTIAHIGLVKTMKFNPNI